MTEGREGAWFFEEGRQNENREGEMQFLDSRETAPLLPSKPVRRGLKPDIAAPLLRDLPDNPLERGFWENQFRR
jgi:hypothetical protein